jgi:hypothetical protein
MGSFQSKNNNNEDTIHWDQINTDDMTIPYNNKYVLSKDEQLLIETLPSMFNINIDTETEINMNNKNTDRDLPFITQEMYKSLVDSNTNIRKQLGGAEDTGDFDDDSSTTSLSTSSESETESDNDTQQTTEKKPKKQYKKPEKQYKKSENKYNKTENKYKKSKNNNSEQQNADYESSDAPSTEGSNNNNNNTSNESLASSASSSHEQAQNRNRSHTKTKVKSSRRKSNKRRFTYNNDSVTDEVGYNNRITIDTEDINMVSDN